MQATFQQRSVIITGAAGFIGSHLSQALLDLGATVYGIDNFLTGQKANIEKLKSHERFQFIEADVIQAPQQYLPTGVVWDYVFHFASPASPPRYQAYPVETYLVNSLGTHQLLQYILEKNISTRFIFAGTSEAYGNPLEHPQKETYWGNVNPNGIRACYDEAKRLGETICGVHHRDFGIDARIVRIFNTYGPHMDPNDGRVIPGFITQALSQKPLTVYGNGSQTRSYCFVSDLVQGILLLATQEGLAGETVNLGNPREYTVAQTAHIISKLINPDIQPQVSYHPLPGDDPTRRQPDISKAKQLLGWEPTISFEDGLQPTIEYFRKLSSL